MSRHEKDLEDMHDLLQQMKDMHEMGLHAPDHCDAWMNEWKQKAAKKIGYTTDQDRIVKYFTGLSAEDQKNALVGFINSTIHPHDTFEVLVKHISADVLLNIVEEKPIDTERSTKTTDNEKITEARIKFKKFTTEAKKADLIQILNEAYKNNKTALDVFNELVLQVMLRNDMKENWHVPKK